MAKRLTKKQKEEKAKKIVEAKERKKLLKSLPNPDESKKTEKPEEPSIIQKEVITCNRCGFKYKVEETVIREQKKCCPECEAPQAWGA